MQIQGKKKQQQKKNKTAKPPLSTAYINSILRIFGVHI